MAPFASLVPGLMARCSLSCSKVCETLPGDVLMEETKDLNFVKGANKTWDECTETQAHENNNDVHADLM